MYFIVCINNSKYHYSGGPALCCLYQYRGISLQKPCILLSVSIIGNTVKVVALPCAVCINNEEYHYWDRCFYCMYQLYDIQYRGHTFYCVHTIQGTYLLLCTYNTGDIPFTVYIQYRGHTFYCVHTIQGTYLLLCTYNAGDIPFTVYIQYRGHAFYCVHTIQGTYLLLCTYNTGDIPFTV